MATSMIRGNLMCSVCQGVYRSPRLLPCFHSFCSECIEGLIRNHTDSFPCPQCRKSSPIPPNGAAEFQMNFHITEEDMEQERKRLRMSMCPSHYKEELSYFCLSYDKTICVRCKLTKHEGHETEDLVDEVARCESRLEALRDRIASDVDYLTKNISQAHINIEAARLKKDNLKQVVKERRNAIVRKVDLWHDRLMKDLEQCSSSIDTELTNEADHMQCELDYLQQQQDRLNHVLSEARDADKMCAEREICQGEDGGKELSEVKTCVPDVSKIPVLNCDDVCPFTDDAIRRCLGYVSRMSVPFAPESTYIRSVITAQRHLQ